MSNRMNITVQDGRTHLSAESKTDFGRSINAAVEERLVVEGQPSGISTSK